MELHIIRFHTDTSFLFFFPTAKKENGTSSYSFPSPTSYFPALLSSSTKDRGRINPHHTRRVQKAIFRIFLFSLSLSQRIFGFFPFLLHHLAQHSARLGEGMVDRLSVRITPIQPTSTTLVLLFPPFHLLPAMVRFCSTKIPPNRGGFSLYLLPCGGDYATPPQHRGIEKENDIVIQKSTP